jgi:hypothetical protein
MALGPSLHIGADAAEIEQVAGALRIAESSSAGVAVSAVISSGAHLGESGIDLGAREHPAALGDQLAVVVVPRRARQLEQAAALGIAGWPGPGRGR